MAGIHLGQLLLLGQDQQPASSVYEARAGTTSSSSTSMVQTRSLRLPGMPASKSQMQQAAEDLGKHVGRGIAIPGKDVTHEITPGVMFRHYARDHFARFRETCGIPSGAFEKSLGSLEGVTTNPAGKSGSLFFFSSDGQYVLKTITRGEKEKLLSILPDYVSYVEEARKRDRPCLLSRFYGVYSIAFSEGCVPKAAPNTLHLLAMDNVFSGSRPDRIYDLKGTTEDRFVEPDSGRVLKDQNFADNQLCLPEEQVETLMEAVRQDTAFLELHGIMDYSLILGVFEGGAPPDHTPGHREMLAGSELVDDELPRPAAFQMAIIDTLVSWTVKKQAAYWLKKPTLGCCVEIDTEPPEQYRARFIDMVEEKLAPDADSESEED